MKIKHILLSLCLALLCSQAAHAKRGFAVINTGDELFEVAAFPSKLVSELPALRSMRAGYKCSHFGVFWADIWTWDCKLVAVTSENSYADLPYPVASQLSADSSYSMRKAQRGFWNHYGFWSVLAAFLGIALVRRVF